jgi:CubicO group peptidase (beta-lactamase class C family)
MVSMHMNAEVTATSSPGISRRDVICRVAGASLSLLGSGLAQDREPAGAAAAACKGLLKKHDVPGAAIAFAERGEIRWIVAKGLADKGSGRPMGADARFEAASLSKPAFACAVLRLCEQGKLSLDAELSGILREEDLPSDVGFRRVTVRQILTHTSGIQADPPKGRAAKLLFPPGSRFAYSPHAFDYLQRAAESVTSRPLKTIMEDLVLSPVGMTHSAFDWDTSVVDSRAVGHDAKGKPGQTINERVWRMPLEKRQALHAQYPLMNFPNAASSLITTASDYAHFLLATTRPHPVGLLSEETRKAIMAPETDAGKGVNWGLVFGLISSPTRGLGLWHWGDFGIFQNFAAVFPEADIAVVSLTNGTRGQRFNKDIARLLLNEEPTCFAWLRV